MPLGPPAESVNIVTVTKMPLESRCGWCHRIVNQSDGPGRPRQFCGRSHRQRAYEARRRAESLGIPPGQVIVEESSLRVLHDRLYQLESAVDDVAADLAESSTATAYRLAFEHLMAAAQSLVGTLIEPSR